MAYARGLTEIDGNFKTEARLVAADVVIDSLVFIDGVPFNVDVADGGSGIALDNGLFANPVLTSPFTIRESFLDNPLVHLYTKNDLVRVLAGSSELASDRNTVAKRVDINGIVRDVAIDDPREEESGWLFEGDSENESLHRRDFTNAAWVKTNLTALKDAIGRDGVANAASTLTATAANGTAFQTVTKASAENTYSIDIRRKTGTGTIEITDDGSSTLTDITSLINTLTYTRFQITTTQANPEFGVRIVTSGDEIEVDFAQLEVLEFASSRMDDPALPAATTSRSADDQSFPSAENFRESEGAIFLIADVIGDTGIAQRFIDISDGTSDNRLSVFRDPGGTIRVFGIRNGAVQGTLVSTSTIPIGESVIICVTYLNDEVSLFINGVLEDNDVSFLIASNLNIVDVGRKNDGTTELFGHIQDLRFYPGQLTISEIKHLGGN